MTGYRRLECKADNLVAGTLSCGLSIGERARMQGEQPTTEPYTFRLAMEDDLWPLALMHVQAWREAYRGLMPDTVLNALDPKKREAAWRQTLSQGTPVTLAIIQGIIVGFMGCGARRDATLPADGEIYGLYVLQRAQRHGVGRKLFQKGIKLLAQRQFSSAALWVFERNSSARRFYEIMGGEVCAHRIEARDGWELGEVAYLWQNLPVSPHL